MIGWLSLLAAIFSEVGASLSLKAAVDNPAWYITVVLGYTFAFVMLFQSLKAGLALGVAYGVWAASGVALTAILASAVFGEPMTALKTLGIVLVMGGVLLVEIGSQRANQRRLDEQALRGES
ncbi:multidrug efflux SMR transporter [Corynebacterium glyciniphilum]|uniref:DMT family transporter n=1 Tax=Corynebacterium glyciniphilum TaxID=1404244 RepID=UPI0011AB8C7F|nr:multidrug efflux SMR transporter [Corynebacterium glyciniphilum]MDN5682864.1 multidrug efflux SMR transporter [Corynebacterium glyciniphilum]MDN6705181.1 multidrug efflux SMR transporter [Corynebacterium glyciniphilum]